MALRLIQNLVQRLFRLVQRLFCADCHHCSTTWSTMKLYLYSLLLLASVFCSCSKSSNAALSFHAVVMGPNMDCGIYQIKFSSGVDSARVFMSMPSQLTGICIAQNLPDVLKVPGLKIVLSIRKPQPSELGACTAMGPSYPWTHVLSAKKDPDSANQ